ncbi:hypothetical protein JEQ12_004314 [Ovis aries]|uniref:SREBP regulating gene protein n=1 Tax=Ovis aries TaxID=9940 RepID=A0A835ZVQ5_SHEEP|nr:hypothetical protein JEQ12_004314 [Ovis aries]
MTDSYFWIPPLLDPFLFLKREKVLAACQALAFRFEQRHLKSRPGGKGFFHPRGRSPWGALGVTSAAPPEAGSAPSPQPPRGCDISLAVQASLNCPECGPERACLPQLLNSDRKRKYCCGGCLSNGCCNACEYCVSCCLKPNKQLLLERFLNWAAVVFQNLFKDYFELCFGLEKSQQLAEASCQLSMDRQVMDKEMAVGQTLIPVPLSPCLYRVSVESAQCYGGFYTWHCQLRAAILESTAVPDMQWIQSDELLKQAMKNINQVIKNSFKSFPSLVFPAFTTTLTSPVYKQLFPVPRAREAVQEKWMEAINRTILEHEFYKPSNHVKFSFSDTGQQNGGLPRLRLELDRVCMLLRLGIGERQGVSSETLMDMDNLAGLVRNPICLHLPNLPTMNKMPEAQRILHLRGENAVALPRCGPPGPAGKRYTVLLSKEGLPQIYGKLFYALTSKTKPSPGPTVKTAVLRHQQGLQ